ncbi:ABC transporter permease subunit [Roseiconus lacunae]|uniref:ABC transporter permease n=1 Tax=Roseiconus lacunae TaxID=2605694 RepID=A0ABT7PQU6_9BACT|nr:hypothetical protein [Roseiconus lacunae]MDM4018882.1 hypothetical protein [Roseiconus lacunae]
MNKVLGIFGLLIFVCLFTTILNDSFVGQGNLYNITRWSALFGILSIGVSFVIITGGIDLSIGSVVGLVACLLPMLVIEHGFSPIAAIAIVMGCSALIGLLHGILITRLDLQPFVVTLCGLLFYRGFSRWLTDDQTLGFGQAYDDGLRLLATGKPASWATMLAIGGVLVFVGGLWKAIWRPRESSGNTFADHISRWGWPVMGVFVAIVGSARFWKGWDTGPGPVILPLGEYQIRGIEVSVAEGAAQLPSRVMVYAASLLFIPAFGLFLGSAIKQNAKRVAFPIIAVVVSLLLLVASIWALVPVFREATPDDTWRVGAVTVSGGALKTGVMLIEFLFVAFAIVAVGWLYQAGRTASVVSKAVSLPMMVFGVLALLGQTDLVATMVPMPMLLLIGLAVAASIFLNRTVYGRYLLALGSNEEAARYSGINTKRMVVLSYVLCSMAAGLGGILFALDINSVQPSGFGNFYELYAIAAAVLGGCSLRGGEGNILGVVIGAAVMRVLYNAINILGISTKLEFAIIGIVILAGVIVDVVVKRMIAKRALVAAESARLASAEPANG